MSAVLEEILPTSRIEENHQVLDDPPDLGQLVLFLAAFQAESKDYKIWPVRLAMTFKP